MLLRRGGEGGGGQRGQLDPPGKLFFFSNIVFEFAEVFLVAILVRNYKKLTKKSFNVNSK